MILGLAIILSGVEKECTRALNIFKVVHSNKDGDGTPALGMPSQPSTMFITSMEPGDLISQVRMGRGHRNNVSQISAVVKPNAHSVET